jgi:acyl-CoA synthetase (AMP-forming)/AMP-acid ligase II
MKHPDLDAFDFSGIKLVVFAGQSMSADELERMQEFFAQHGGSPTIINGYGLSECGAAALLSVYDGSYHGIGKALSGVTLRILDDSDHGYHSPEVALVRACSTLRRTPTPRDALVILPSLSSMTSRASPM